MSRGPAVEGRSAHVIPVLVLAQFAGTSPWFAGNAVLPELQQILGIADLVAWTTGAVQVGFITGTLLIAISGLADRMSGTWLFACSALGAAAANLGVLAAESLVGLVVARWATGLCLAGVYPIGMKLAASWSDPRRGGLGSALGFLVGALVLGTALPHGLRALGASLPWRGTLVATSALAAVAGVGVWLTVRDGPHVSIAGRLKLGAVWQAFRAPAFRASALGYFGHMWELYTVWALIPALLAAHDPDLAVSGWSFAVIGAGAVGCAVGGRLAERWGSARVAGLNLTGSAALCATAPLWIGLPTSGFLVLLLAWGALVVGDSPQLSALTARTAPPELVGSALTLVTCIGFGLTVVSIAVANAISLGWALPLLAVGPVLGRLALRPALARD